MEPPRDPWCTTRMIGRVKTPATFALCSAICALAWVSGAAAGPPASRGVPLGHVSSDFGATRAGTMKPAGTVNDAVDRLGSRRLDLRPPSDFASKKGPTDSMAFPALRGAQTRANDDERFPALGDEGLKFRAMSQPEQIARRLHREGLPVARLWESHSALVSLGLSPRGKPGLWLIQKVH
jgi:hypothetical protein